MSDSDIISEDQAVFALLKTAPDLLREHFSPDCCIAAACIGIEALTYYGIKSEPVSVALNLFNQRAVEVIKEVGHMIAVDDERAEEYVQSGYWVSLVGKTGQKAPGKWDGHLVIGTDNYLVDLTLGFLKPPPSGGIVLEASSFQRPQAPEWSAYGYVIPGGGLAVYNLYADDTTYKDARDWNPRRWRDITALLIRGMKPMLGKGN